MQNVMRKFDVEHEISCNNVSDASENDETLRQGCHENARDSEKTRSQYRRDILNLA